MKFHIITIFPKTFDSYLNTSILKRAQDKNIFEPIFYNLCDYSDKNTRRVDSRPYWGLPWTIFSPEPLSRVIEEIFEKHWKMEIIFFSPKWKKLKQQICEKFAKSQKDYILICGHYEWIDQRIIDIYKIKEISIGEYVMTSWELAAMVFMDSIIRLIPWVISSESLLEESFSNNLFWKKEYPQYTRPENFKWINVPKELLSWNPNIIEEWKKQNIT